LPLRAPFNAVLPHFGKHTRTGRATYAAFGEAGRRGWKVAQFRGSLWARSVCWSVEFKEW
ncbi:MAG: hypothetical protein KGJ80_21015, partial [Chloroflexota bacterium]|nr:hypothetical protein [Chloroflexota bacterium]